MLLIQRVATIHETPLLQNQMFCFYVVKYYISSKSNTLRLKMSTENQKHWTKEAKNGQLTDVIAESL